MLGFRFIVYLVENHFALGKSLVIRRFTLERRADRKQFPVVLFSGLRHNRELRCKFNLDHQAGYSHVLCGGHFTPIANNQGHYIKKRYPELFFNTANHLNFKRMVANVYELTDFLVNKVKFDDFGAEFPYKVTFHDSCSALRGLGLGKEARQLLSKVKGLELVEMKQTDLCCGADFSMEVNHETLASGMAAHKVKNALNTGAEYIVSTDMTCLMHQRTYIEKEGLPIKVIHIADVLASGWE